MKYQRDGNFSRIRFTKFIHRGEAVLRKQLLTKPYGQKTSGREWCLRNQEMQWYESYLVTWKLWRSLNKSENFEFWSDICTRDRPIVGAVNLNMTWTPEVMGWNPMGSYKTENHTFTRRRKNQVSVNTVAIAIINRSSKQNWKTYRHICFWNPVGQLLHWKHAWPVSISETEGVNAVILKNC